MKNKIKSLLLKMVKFMVILLVVDFAFGFLAKQVYFSQKTGKQSRITRSIKKDTSQIVIFGSSHANRHYVPNVFEKKLNKSTYNAGVQGQGILFHNVLQSIMLERTKPELIILNIDHNWLYEREDAYDRLSDLQPYYWEYREHIRPTIGLKAKLVDFKLLFKAYQYNSTLVHALRYLVTPQKDLNGFIPLTGVVQKPKSEVQKGQQEPLEVLNIDENFTSAYESFILKAKKNDIKLLIVISPVLEKRDLSNHLSMRRLRQIALKHNIPIKDFYNDSRFNAQYDLFNDTDHLNYEGAKIFSSFVSDFVKIYLK